MFPLKKHVFCRQRRALTVIVVLLASLSYSQIFRLIIFGIEAGSCEAPEIYRHIYIILHVYLYQLVLQFLLPTVLILVFNLTILYRLRCRRNQQFARPGSGSQGFLSNLSVRKKRKTTCMLMTISFTYLVTILPLLVVSLMIHIALVADLDLARNLFVHLADLRNVLELVSEVNYASNFYIYVLTGADFRLTICRIFRSTASRRDVSGGVGTMSFPMTTEKERERGYRGSRKLASFTPSNRLSRDN